MSQRIVADLNEEFRAQALKERALGLPVSVLVATGCEATAKMERGFIAFVVRPLYVTLSDIVPALAETLDLIDANSEAWEEQRPSESLPNTPA